MVEFCIGREECSGVTCGSLIGCGSLQVISVVPNTSFLYI